MAGRTPKTITVTYGTFSCTVEGVRHPVAAVKEIAEYFCTLTATYPGFGMPGTHHSAPVGETADPAAAPATSAAVIPMQPAADAVPVRRQAPLVLVSSQRVDGPVHVMPRRISAAQIRAQEFGPPVTGKTQPAATPAERRAFVKFLSNSHAKGLHDVIEAAAAYLTQTSGQAYFTPVDVMQRVSTIPDVKAAAHDARIETFIMLLREGKIIKRSQGRYVLGKTSRYFRQQA